MSKTIYSGKALPRPPDADVDESGQPGKESEVAQKPLPFLPAPKMPSAATIPRRPVGGKAHMKAVSISTLLSLYSDSSDLPPRSPEELSLSNSSLNSIELEELNAIPLHLGLRDDELYLEKDISISQYSTPISSPQSTSSGPEIWKRRSPERSVSITDLKLTKSNGFTSQPLAFQPSLQTREPLKSIQTNLLQNKPSSTTTVVRKPIPARSPPLEPESMGIKGSKLSKLRKRVLRVNKDEVSQVGPKVKIHSDPFISPISCLPASEYEKSDYQPQVAPQLVSPVSPESPPYQSPTETRHGYDKAFVAPSTVSPLASTSNLLLPPHSREPSDNLTIATEHNARLLPQPPLANGTNILETQQSHSRSPSGIVSVKSQKPSVFSRSSPVPLGTIFAPPSLCLVQLDCYQGHGSMRRSRNDLCPLACGICEIKDAQPRWTCCWCCLRCCEKCMQMLASTQNRDLRLCLRKIGREDRFLMTDEDVSK